MGILNKIGDFLNEEEAFDAAEGVEALRKIVAKGEDGWLKFKDGTTEVSNIAARFLLKVYDMLGMEKKQAFQKKFNTKRDFMNLYLVSKGVALGESTFSEGYDKIKAKLLTEQNTGPTNVNSAGKLEAPDQKAKVKLTQDGKLKGTFATENEALKWLHNNVSYSWDHAFKHEGWKMEKI